MITIPIHILRARLKDAPQVNIRTVQNQEPFSSFDAAYWWCEQHCYDYVLLDLKENKVVFDSRKHVYDNGIVKEKSIN